jgi:hypothetical protein
MATEIGPIQATPNEMRDAAPATTRRRPRPWTVALFGVLVLPLVIAGALTAAGPRVPDPLDARVVSAKTLEAEFGLRFDLVAVTASGGLIDLRFTVLDQTKAEALFHDVATRPALFVERSGKVLRSRKGMAHHLTLVTGGRYFMLFSNSGGAIQSGTQVSVVIEDIRLEPMVAQS